MLHSRLAYTIHIFFRLYAIFISIVCYTIKKINIFYTWCLPHCMLLFVLRSRRLWLLANEQTGERVNNNLSYHFSLAIKLFNNKLPGPRHRFIKHNFFYMHACHYIHTVYLKILLRCTEDTLRSFSISENLSLHCRGHEYRKTITW